MFLAVSQQQCGCYNPRRTSSFLSTAGCYKRLTSDFHWHTKPTCNHVPRTPHYVYVLCLCLEYAAPYGQEVLGSQRKPQEARYFLNGILFFWYFICWKTLPAPNGFHDWWIFTSSHVFWNNMHWILKITQTNLSEWCKDVKPSSVCVLYLHWGDLKFPWLSPV